jgi:hypothetical protein
MSDIGAVPTIRELIRAALDGGRSVRDLEHDSGYRVKFQTFQHLSVNAPDQFPKKVDTIVGMAEALNVTSTAVVMAYAQSLGIPMEVRSTFAMRLPPDADDLDIEVQNALIAVVRASVRSRRRVFADKPEPRGGRVMGRFAPGEDPGVRRDEQSG